MDLAEYFVVCLLLFGEEIILAAVTTRISEDSIVTLIQVGFVITPRCEPNGQAERALGFFVVGSLFFVM